VPLNHAGLRESKVVDKGATTRGASQKTTEADVGQGAHVQPGGRKRSCLAIVYIG